MDVAAALGEFRAQDPSLHWAGRAAFFVALCLTGILERVQFRLRFLETRTWWASNGRDVLNLAALAMLFGSAWLMGFSAPLALALAASIVVLVNALQSGLGARSGATRTSVAIAVLLGSPALILPSAVDRAARAALAVLF